MSINYKLGFVAVLVMLMSGSAFAKTYGVWLKNSSGVAFEKNNLKCATGTVSDSGEFSMRIAAGCFDSDPASPKPTADVTITSLAGTAIVKTSDIVITTGNPPVTQQAVTSADGVLFTGGGLVLGWTPRAPETGIRNFEFKVGTTLVAAGAYHLFTQDSAGNPVPEPETLWLAVIGLAGLALTRRKRK